MSGNISFMTVNAGKLRVFICIILGPYALILMKLVIFAVSSLKQD